MRQGTPKDDIDPHFPDKKFDLDSEKLRILGLFYCKGS
eukprot:CAMPEP_0116879146 /NCGR_PEP_ID=MMETSP0463-20121206/10904_1 /TAXON_ID=181622 /ORGANISM="Strombidinopsis sp, Strain SopsisLIS2011" /LENGTH=37 /DNA_ID= /DNA_START= /DNA_END= /DNA_ORIENTATION=